MAKKYLTLEEAARQLGWRRTNWSACVSDGEIRGFADRGTWKFRSEDVEEFARSRDADSSPEVPIIDDKPGRKSPSCRRQRHSQRLESGRFNKTSDSDVRLLLDETLVPGGKDSDPEVVLSQLGHQRQRRAALRRRRRPGRLGSDSDVKLISTSSDMLLPSDEGSSDASDSDVKLVAADSDSDVRLAKPARPEATRAATATCGWSAPKTWPRSSQRQRLAAHRRREQLGSSAAAPRTRWQQRFVHQARRSTSSVNLGRLELRRKFRPAGPDSGIALDTGSGMKVGGGSSADSGITLQSLADSGISLEKVDSGISLAGPMDSGIALDADSGIALEQTDSGIALSADSGIRLDPDASAKTNPRPRKRKGPQLRPRSVDDRSTRTRPKSKSPCWRTRKTAATSCTTIRPARRTSCSSPTRRNSRKTRNPSPPVSRKKGRAGRQLRPARIGRRIRRSGRLQRR